MYRHRSVYGIACAFLLIINYGVRAEQSADVGKDCPPRTLPVEYTIPTIDLTGETERVSIVASRPGQYYGHPHTLLLEDQTILCVYPLGHGGPSAVMKKSTDGGRTWSDELPVPKNWVTARNCPTIHRLADPNGVERLFVFEGNGPLRQSVSLNNGRTWTPFQPNGLHTVVPPITIVPIRDGRQLLAVYQRGKDDKDQSPQTLWQSVSDDGGLTWGPEIKIAAYPCADLTEPTVIRSPDGKQLACLIRENQHHYNSMLMISNDEARTWSEPTELPAALTGHRHMPRYARDGRLVITFRDAALGSPTLGEFVAWVGTYDDIVNGREGQYRIRLLTSPKKWDLGYAGLELLPDDTFVATTYIVLKEGQKNSVVSVRFKLSEIDAKAAAMKK